MLDAITYAGGLTPEAMKANIRLVRPAPPGACCEQVLPINYEKIITGDTATNYQLLPGDRLIIAQDPLAVQDHAISAESRPSRSNRSSDSAELERLDRRLEAVERRLDRIDAFLGLQDNTNAPRPASSRNGP